MAYLVFDSVVQHSAVDKSNSGKSKKVSAFFFQLSRLYVTTKDGWLALWTVVSVVILYPDPGLEVCVLASLKVDLFPLS